MSDEELLDMTIEANLPRETDPTFSQFLRELQEDSNEHRQTKGNSARRRGERQANEARRRLS